MIFIENLYLLSVAKRGVNIFVKQPGVWKASFKCVFGWNAFEVMSVFQLKKIENQVELKLLCYDAMLW